MAMEPTRMEVDDGTQQSADPLPFARSYQLEALDAAIKRNTIVFLETGSGKTLIAIMLLRSYSHLLRKPSPFVAVFLVPQVVLVQQQAEAIKMHTDLNVGMYWGAMGVDFWDAKMWKQQIEKYEVLVMTHAILLNNLRHSFFKLSMIKVLIMDECHHASGKHSYACIMRDFFHRQLESGQSELPRIFGMTASPIKSKGGNPELSYWKTIHELETLMNSKVYTCVDESVLAEFIPTSTPKFEVYKCGKIPSALYTCLTNQLNVLKEKHELSTKSLDLVESSLSIRKKLMKFFSALTFCLEELGVWLALKAAWFFSHNDTDIFTWEKLDVMGERIIRSFSLEAYKSFARLLPSDPKWMISDDFIGNVNKGFLTSKVIRLIQLLLQYRGLKNLRCIVFVERVITAVVLESLLNEFLPKHNDWKSKYIAGNNSGMQSQTRKKHNEIVEEFRNGMVNIIVATSILEEGLDVQSCNLVIRFDPSSTVCSFIQSRGRARMQNSDYVLMVESGDSNTHSRLQNYLASGDIMRKESLRHSSLPCSLLEIDLQDDGFYRVESTGASLTLESSIGLMYFYCSRLPSDGYFKPAPRWDEETRTLHLPKSCPIPYVRVEGSAKILKKIACFEACKQLHKIGALTDNLVPDIVMEEAPQDFENEPYDEEQSSYVPSELVKPCPTDTSILYHCYFVELDQNFGYEIPTIDFVLGMRSELDSDIPNLHLELEFGRGFLTVNFKYAGDMLLDSEQVLLCRRFQITIFRILMDHNLNKLKEALNGLCLGENLGLDYLLLPGTRVNQRPSMIDWKCVTSVLFSREEYSKEHTECSIPSFVHTKNGLICTCMIRNSVVCTPHNGSLYCITGLLEELNGNSLLQLSDGRVLTYKKYYVARHGLNLRFDKQLLLKGKRIFHVKKHVQRGGQQTEKESSNIYVELPPELCSIIMSPISLSCLYTFSFVPSIMHHLEALLIAANLKKMLLDQCMQNVNIPTIKVLEAITTKKSQEKIHLESLEALGDSFLKYAASQQLFRTYQNNHEGLLSVKKDRIVSNAALCRVGCNYKLPGFIQNEPFDPKKWIIPGDFSEPCLFKTEFLTNERNIYIRGTRKIKSKSIADVVEALIGAFLSTGGEMAAVYFMNWVGIKVDFTYIPYERNFPVEPEKLVNVKHLESLLNYSFRDPSLLVEALTHGSYMLPEIPGCYQRLEFLGDAVLDYLITIYLYKKYPRMSPGVLTDMRSASVNNDCYARSAVKAELHKHILHASHKLHKDIVRTIANFQRLSTESTFGWESETSFPKVLGDIVESLGGAIYVDSGYDKNIVFQSIRPLLEPLVTPETMTLHPARELNEYCSKMHYDMKKPVKSFQNDSATITIEVEANGVTYKHASTASDRKTAKKLACKEVLRSLKERAESSK
ncbi:putative ribonuclease III post-transcriptional gene silencing PAZ-Argonaute family [Rosa chinensis]|uniref:Putative ribonuclease III post-transcriptional gene silencing PAZ-Argonaute family n=1 Tax=Rosa chinensis TaxID=74649 RepID=A0A2P6R500_ROSCH|nr:endoribonuclease Dicer homolog 2 [Rosa chinensis]XP_040373107.1 endoribonuclease Dicer homolog 2 [Rosa chinensis]PRQ41503.1 putative ribonuclease III post-transcriptional gene silencing PAZ-Argonaute family [Rosa chinensis]